MKTRSSPSPSPLLRKVISLFILKKKKKKKGILTDMGSSPKEAPTEDRAGMGISSHGTFSPGSKFDEGMT